MCVNPAKGVSVLGWLIDRGLDKWQRQVDKFKFRVYWANLTQKLYRCRNCGCFCQVGVVSVGCRKSVLLKVLDSAVYLFVATTHLESEDGLGAWYRHFVLLYGQVVDASGHGRWCGRINCTGWMIDVLFVQYFGLLGLCWCGLEVLMLVRAKCRSLTRRYKCWL